jgi:hypothetical protein
MISMGMKQKSFEFFQMLRFSIFFYQKFRDWFKDTFGAKGITPLRTPRISGLKSQILKPPFFKLDMMVKRGIVFLF